MEKDVTCEENDMLLRFLNGLDNRSKAMFWHFWLKRHAELAELRDAATLESDMDALMHIKEILNPRAQDFFSEEILVFHRSKFDPETGEKVLFHWWLDLDLLSTRERKNQIIDLFQDDKSVMLVAEVPDILVDSAEINFCNGILTVRLQQANPETRPGLPSVSPNSPADIFDEGDRLVVIMDLPEAEEISIQITLSGYALLILTSGRGGKLRRQVALPCSVKRVWQQNYHNGILQVELVKRGDSHA
jgi:HSP20 family molecular chaperone IbpA